MRKLILGAAIAGALVLSAQQKKADVQLQSAINREVVAGDLKGAIEEYKKIIAANRGNHAVAAKALVQMAQCYEKLGDSEAKKAYDQVLRDYPDQKELAEVARVSLAKLGGASPAPQPPARLLWASMRAEGGSISPDGRILAYTDWDTGNLVLHDFVSGADRALTSNGSWKDGESAFADTSAISRDGKKLAYGWWDERLAQNAGSSELRVLDLSGDSQARRLLQAWDIEPTAWSPDRKWIAATVSKSKDDNSRQICLINSEDGSMRVLKSVPRLTYTGGFSPDGKYVLYVERSLGNNGSTRAYILSIDGKSDVPLSTNPTALQELPVWTPDGSRIVFGTPARNGTAAALWSIRVADGKPTGEPEPLKADTGGSPVGFSQDGSLLYYRRGTGGSDIYLADIDPSTGKLTSAAKRINQQGLGNSWGKIAWLPDSKAVSFWTRRDGRDAVVVHTLAKGEERELWTIGIGERDKGRVGWFPDGSLMATELRGQDRIIRRINGDTGEVLATWTIPDPPGGPGWGSPELMTIFFARKEESVPCQADACTWVLIGRSIETGRDREICRLNAISVTAPVESPNGRDIAFIARNRQKQPNGLVMQSIMVAPTSGGSPVELYNAGTGIPLAPALAWTKDGSRVLAFWLKDHEEGVWSFPAKGGAPEKSPLNMPVNGGGSASVSPDGTHLAFVGITPNPGTIWLIPGLFPPARTAAQR